MSFTYKKSSKALPIAKVAGSQRFIYILPDSGVFPEIPVRNVKSQVYKCPYCKKTITSKGGLIHHLTKSCPKKKSIVMDTKPCITLSECEFIYKLPSELSEHEVILVTGPPKCGKSYWVNEYVKAFKEMYNLPVFRISRVDHDETIEGNHHSKDWSKNYNFIRVSDRMALDKFKIEDFKNSLVIFDDIESAEARKGTQTAYELLDDLVKNGRHENCSVIFCNQECRMGMKTKPILTCITGVVLFPRAGNNYQYNKLLEGNVGLCKNQRSKLLELNTRWAYVSVQAPKYVMYEHGMYLIGKEAY